MTNHSFVGGRAVGYQAILQAGTAVLVDSSGRPVVRCRCGNPLLEPIFIPTAKCLGCPPDYRPPPPCTRRCWRRYPDPPPTIIDRFEPEEPRREEPGINCANPRSQLEFELCRDRQPREEEPPPEPADVPARAQFSPSSGPATATFVLSVSGFEPNRELHISVIRPSGTEDTFSMSTGPNGTGSRSFPSDPSREIGTYTVTVSDPSTGEQASDNVTVTGG